jgi:NhaP-type Na+/H+ and K+/H+ antiporter
MALEYVLLVGPILILVSIGIARLSDNLGVPAMLLFLGIGMLAGSEGPGGIFFDDAGLAQSIGIVELGMHPDSLIVLLSRDDSFLVPSGGTIHQEGDTVLVLVNKNNLPLVRAVLTKPQQSGGAS